MPDLRFFVLFVQTLIIVFLIFYLSRFSFPWPPIPCSLWMHGVPRSGRNWMTICIMSVLLAIPQNFVLVFCFSLMVLGYWSLSRVSPIKMLHFIICALCFHCFISLVVESFCFTIFWLLFYFFKFSCHRKFLVCSLDN